MRFSRVVLKGDFSEQQFQVKVRDDLLPANKYTVSIEHFALQRGSTTPYSVELVGLGQPASYNSNTGNCNSVVFTAVANEYHGCVSMSSIGALVTTQEMLMQNPLTMRITNANGTALNEVVYYVLVLLIHPIGAPSKQ